MDSNASTNPVNFPDLPAAEELTIYSPTLSEFAWKNRLVGVARSGFYYVDEKVARKGYYDFYPKLLDWSGIEEVRICLYIDVRGIVLGLLLLAAGFLAFLAGWSGKTHYGPKLLIIAIGCGFGGGKLVLGAVRNRIVVVTADGAYRWVSQPLTYRKTLPICRETTELCRPHGLLLSSHVDEAS